MKSFDFQISPDIGAALEHGAHDRFLAGGTTLVDLMKLDVEAPDRVVDITTLPLKEIQETKSGIQIGALVTNSDLAHHTLIQKNLPVLSQALLSGASVQLRNSATTGGNLLQRTRCSYFRDTACACNKRRPGSGCSALEGNNRTHAILGGSSHCIATHPSDMAVAMMALEAKVLLRGREGSREVPLSGFYQVPGATPHVETVLQPGELITAVEIPKRAWYRHSVYLKVRDRASYAFALSSVAAALEIGEGRVKNARIAFGGIGTIPWRSLEAEHVLTGQKLTPALAEAAAKAALGTAQPHEHNRFKVKLAGNTLVRALHQLGDLS